MCFDSDKSSSRTKSPCYFRLRINTMNMYYKQATQCLFLNLIHQMFCCYYTWLLFLTHCIHFNYGYWNCWAPSLHPRICDWFNTLSHPCECNQSPAQEKHQTTQERRHVSEVTHFRTVRHKCNICALQYKSGAVTHLPIRCYHINYFQQCVSTSDTDWCSVLLCKQDKCGQHPELSLWILFRVHMGKELKSIMKGVKDNSIRD